MKLCKIRCTVLDMETQAVAHLLNEWGIPRPPTNSCGLSYDDFTFGFITDDEQIIRDGDCILDD